MICEFRNKIEKYNNYVFFGQNGTNEFVNETTLIEFIFFILACIITTILLTWWLVPIRELIWIPLLKILNMKFKCSRSGKP